MSSEKARSTRRADGYSIQKRRDGRWEARVLIGYNENGNPKRKSFYGETRSQVLEEAKRFKMQLDAGGFAPVTRDSTVGQWLDSWLETYVRPRREPKTTEFYEAYIRLHLKPAFGKVPLRKLTVQHVQRLMNEKSAEGLSPSFVRGLRATLRAALNQAWKEGLVEQNIAARVTSPKMEQRDPDFLRPDEVGPFLEAAKGHTLENLFRFGIATGVRIGEASGLRWCDVDFLSENVAITKQLQRVQGKLVLKDLKSKSSRRTTPLVGIALDALRSEKAVQVLAGFDNPEGLVFLNSEGRPLDPKYVDSHLKATLEKAGLRRLSFHKLRHTAATLMVAAGVELHQVKQQLGHSQISLTANLYAQGVSEAQRRAANVLDGVLKRGNLHGDGNSQGP